MKVLLTALLMALQPIVAFAQQRVKGSIQDATTHAPIAYCNIGIPEKGIGTVCNEQGVFELVVPREYAGEMVMIAHLGYEDRLLPISELTKQANGLEIQLQPTAIKLPEVAIHASRQMAIGYRPTSSAAKGFFKAEGLGMEGGTLIRHEGAAALQAFHMNILRVPFDSLKFRLNIYEVRKGRLAEKLNRQDVVFTITKADTGIYTQQLEGLQVAGDFICTIELVELFGNTAEHAEFLFSALQDKQGVIYKRGISMAKWDRVRNFSLCFWFDGRG